MPTALRCTIRALATLIADGGLCLDPGADREEAVARLLEIGGIGPWTAQYVSMRALGDPDVLMTIDLGMLRGGHRHGPRRPSTTTWPGIWLPGVPTRRYDSGGRHEGVHCGDIAGQFTVLTDDDAVVLAASWTADEKARSWPDSGWNRWVTRTVGTRGEFSS
jgi:hypothetical protein